MIDDAKDNTDRELWRERAGDYYVDSIHLTKDGGIGINCGGQVIVAPLRSWFAGLQATNQADKCAGLTITCSVLCSLAMLHLEGHLWDVPTTFCGDVPVNPDEGLRLLSIPFMPLPDVILNVALAARQIAEVVIADGYRRFYRPSELRTWGHSTTASLVSTRQGLAIRINKEFDLYCLSVACAK